MILKEPLEQAVWHSLDSYNYDDAIFLADRLVAETPNSDDAVWLLATCLFRAGQHLRVYHLLKSKSAGNKSTRCRFLFAKTCFELERFAECEKALLFTPNLQSGFIDTLVNEYPDCASSVLHLLGRVCVKTERLVKAVEYFSKSLKLNPFQWSSYEKLCDLGQKLDPTKIFSLTPELTRNINTYVSNAVNAGYHSAGNLAGSASGVPGFPTNVASNNNSNAKVASVRPQSAPTLPLQGLNTSIQPAQTPVMNLINSMTTPSTESTPTMTTPCNQLFVEIASSPCVAKPPAVPQKGRPVAKLGRNLLNTSTSVNLPITPSFGVAPIAETPPQPTYGGGEDQGSNLMFITPSPVQVMDSITMPDPRAPAKKVMSRKGIAANTRSKPPVFSSTSVNSNVQQPTNVSQQNIVRRSSRLFASSNSVKENTKSSTNRISSPKAGKKGRISGTKNRSSNAHVTHSDLDVKPESIDQSVTTTATGAATGTVTSSGNHATSHLAYLHQLQSKQIALAEGMLRLLQDLGQAYMALSSYECAKALQLFQRLPQNQYNTAWVLCLVGRSHFELADYTKSTTAFAEAHRLSPNNLEGMEIYSTALWHLQKEVVLSSLAQELVIVGKKTPQAWCVAGNCFSLQKEHDVAIRFFQRAIQIDPYFTYAYTLLGHEYVLTEELDKAIACFRNAVRLDARHYNGWYGIGMIYYKQEKYSLAEVHFKKALSINSESSVLMCHVGVVQHALQHSSLALVTLDMAIRRDPQNPLCKFHKASILFSSDRHLEALKELEELKELVPRESLVYFLMGKVNKKLGNTHLALMNFSWAMDLDPKGANNQIKEAIDKRYITDEEEGGHPSPIEGLEDDETDPQGGIMSLSSQEDVVDDGLSPLRGNLSSPELPSTPVFRYPLRGSGGEGGSADDSDREVGDDDDDVNNGDLASSLGSRDVSGALDRPTIDEDNSSHHVDAINALDSSVDLFQPQTGLDDTIGQSPPLLDGSFRPPGASSALGMEANEEDMQLQASESDESL